MDNKLKFLPPGEHPYDPIKKDIDPVAFALSRVQTLLVWIEEHRASFEKDRSSDVESAERELNNLRIATRDAMIYLERLSDLILGGVAIDPHKRLPEGIERQWFSSCVQRILTATDK